MNNNHMDQKWIHSSTARVRWIGYKILQLGLGLSGRVNNIFN